MKLSSKLYAIGIFRRPGSKECYKYHMVRDLSYFSYFHQEAISDFLNIMSKKVAEKANIGAYNSVKREEHGDVYVCHVHAVTKELACVVVSDEQYPYRIAFDICNKALSQFLELYPDDQLTDDPEESPFPHLQAILEKYKKPEDADQILKMRRDIAETAKAMHENMDKALDRGEKVESLVQKSDMLKDSSKVFSRIIKKNMPTPKRRMTEKVKTSIGLALGSIAMAAITFATNDMISTTITPNNPNATVTTFEATFGLVRTCYSLTTNDDETYGTCTPSRALGGSSSCPDHQASSGTVPSFLGLITMGIFFISVVLALGFGICISKRPDSRKVFAVIALGLHILACICYGVAVYGWADAYSTPYFINKKPGTTWCVPEANIHKLKETLIQDCADDDPSADNGCSRSIAWGYSSFLFWIGFGLYIGVVGLSGGECMQVVFGVDKDKLEDQKLAEAGVTTPLLEEGKSASVVDKVLNIN